MEQLESRALGKPKETVEHQGDGETPVQRRLREMSTEELEALVQRRRTPSTSAVPGPRLRLRRPAPEG
jgi:hypothetical protein